MLLVIGAVAAVGFSSCASESNIAVKVSPDKSIESKTAIREAKVGSLAPEFELAKLDGSTIAFNDLNGKPAVLVFWTAWCPSCKAEAPEINKLAAKYESKGVRVIGINIGEGEARVKEGVEEFGIKYDVVRDTDTKVAKSYKVVGTPTIVFLDSNGIARYVGNELPSDYAARLDEISLMN